MTSIYEGATRFPGSIYLLCLRLSQRAFALAVRARAKRQLAYRTCLMVGGCISVRADIMRAHYRHNVLTSIKARLTDIMPSALVQIMLV